MNMRVRVVAALMAFVLIPAAVQFASATASAAPDWKRCSEPTVTVGGRFGAPARALKARGIGCRRATTELQMLDYRGGRLRPRLGNNWYWHCRWVGQAEDGGYVKCRPADVRFAQRLAAELSLVDGHPVPGGSVPDRPSRRGRHACCGLAPPGRLGSHLDWLSGHLQGRTRRGRHPDSPRHACRLRHGKQGGREVGPGRRVPFHRWPRHPVGMRACLHRLAPPCWSADYRVCGLRWVVWRGIHPT